MFVKLLKHEWRASRSLVGLLCAIVGISGLMIGGTLRNITWSAVTGNQTMANAYSVLLAAAVIALLGCSILVMYLLASRFYKSRFTDEGYLMLMLPVTTHQQLLSSIANTAVGVLLVSTTALVSVAVGMSFYLSLFQQSSAAEIWQVFEDAQVNLSDFLDFSDETAILQLLTMPVTFLADIILFMLALTVSAQAHRHPFLIAAVVYIGTDILVSDGCELAEKLLDNPMLAEGLTCAAYGILAAAAYFIMHHIIDKRLNLT